MEINNWLNKITNTAKNVGNVFFDDLIETEKERKEKEAKALPMPASVMQSGRDEEGRSMATASTFSKPAGQTAVPQYTPSYGGVSYEPKQPKLSYSQEKLIQSYNSAGSPWLDASMRKYATRQMPASDVDKQSAGGYNKSEYKSPAYARQMSYRGLQRGAYSPQTQKAIPKEELINAENKYNGKKYAKYSIPDYNTFGKYDDKSGVAKEILDTLYNRIMVGSYKDRYWFENMVERQEEAKEYLVEVFGEDIGKLLYKDLQYRISKTSYDETKELVSKYHKSGINDFNLDTAQETRKRYGSSDNVLDIGLGPIDVQAMGNYAEESYYNLFGKYVNLSKITHTKGDSGLIGVSDEEVSKRARDKSLSGEERRRYIREEKNRQLRNKQKRQSNHIMIDLDKSPDTVEFMKNVSKGIVTVLAIVSGVCIFVYTGNPEFIYKFTF